MRGALGMLRFCQRETAEVHVCAWPGPLVEEPVGAVGHVVEPLVDLPLSTDGCRSPLPLLLVGKLVENRAAAVGVGFLPQPDVGRA